MVEDVEERKIQRVGFGFIGADIAPSCQVRLRQVRLRQFDPVVYALNQSHVGLDNVMGKPYVELMLGLLLCDMHVLHVLNTSPDMGLSGIHH